jgi:hypothetical protein
MMFVYLYLYVHQKHFLWTMPGPLSSYSALVIHMDYMVDRDASIDPPIHTNYFLSGGATTLIFMVEGAKAATSL